MADQAHLTLAGFCDGRLGDLLAKLHHDGYSLTAPAISPSFAAASNSFKS
jgi:hypothetical protein